MKKIYILGAGGFAKEVHFLIRQIGEYKIIGFVDKNKEKSIEIGGINFPIITDEELLDMPGKCLALGIGDPFLINKLSNKFKYKFDFPNLIHPNVIADWRAISIGKGNIISSGVNITTDVSIGSFNIFNLSCTIGHDTKIGNCNVFNPGANISGGVHLANNIMVGTNSAILQYINIEKNSIIGASSLVNKDVEANTTVVGVPAKKIIKNEIR